MKHNYKLRASMEKNQTKPMWSGFFVNFNLNLLDYYDAYRLLLATTSISKISI